MAKNLLDQLMTLLSPEEQKALQAKLDANPQIKQQADKETEIYSIYLGEDDATRKANEDAAQAERDRQAAEKAATEAKAADDAAKARVAAAGSAAAASANQNDVLAKLNELNTSFTAQIAELKKNFVPMSAVDNLGSVLKAQAAKFADDYALIREDHKEEFGEKLDRDAFEKFVQDHTPKIFAEDGKTVVRLGESPYKNLREAYNAFVGDKRVESKIKKGIEEGTKQKKSGEAVPAQTVTTSMSPSQAVLAKARGEKKAGESNAMAAARRLADLGKERDEAGTVQ